MTVVLLGGIKSLEKHYRRKAKRKGVNLKVFNQACSRSKKAIPGADGLVLFTGEVSHQQAKRAYHISRSKKVPLVKQHSSSMTSFEEALETLSQSVKYSSIRHKN